MIDLIRELWIVLRKEMVYIFRVPDVLIFSVLIPMVLYPSLLVGGAAYALWQAGQKQTHVYSVAVPKDQAERLSWLTDGLKKSKSFKLVPAVDAEDRLTVGTIDALLTARDDGRTVEVHYNEAKRRSSDAVDAIRNEIEELGKSKIRGALKAHGLPSQDLRAFQVKIRDINEMREGEDPSRSGFEESILPMLRYGVLFAVFFLITNARSAAVSPAVFVLAQERDRKTLQSTLSLPVNRNVLVLGKALAVVAMSMLSVLVNAIGVLILILLLMASVAARTQGAAAPAASSTFTGVTLATMGTIIIATLLDILLSSCLLLVLCSWTRTTKEAQSTLIIASLVMVCVSFIALAPNITLNTATATIPLVNLMLVVKAAAKGTATAVPVFITFAESLLLIYVTVHLTSFRLRQESFVLGAQARRPWLLKLSRRQS